MEIARGAEAALKKKGSTLIKDRVRKGYRLDQLDSKLRRKRTRAEAALIREARRSGVNVPRIIEERDSLIKMEFIGGTRVKEALGEKNYKQVCSMIAEAAARLHANGIIHGDLTTSNMILQEKKLFIIDFGLGFRSTRPEDKATDLFLLHEALESTHFPLLAKAWNTILKVYAESYSGADDVLEALRKIEKRRRYTNKLS